MYHHIKKLMFTVRVDEPDPSFGNMLLEQFGGANGELAAAILVDQVFNDSTGKAITAKSMRAGRGTKASPGNSLSRPPSRKCATAMATARAFQCMRKVPA
jgi:hypothetical protein